MFTKLKSLLTVLAVSAALSAYASAAGVDGWRTVRTEHFVFQGDASDAQIRDAAARLEEFRSSISQIYPKLKLGVPGVPTVVLLFKDTASFQPFRPLKANGTADDAVAGYFQPNDDVYYIVTAVGGGGKDLFDVLRSDPSGTLYHEYTHMLVHLNFGRDDIPSWIDEGLAEYFETFRLENDKTGVLGSKPFGLGLALNAKSVMPPEAMFSADDASLQQRSQAARGSFYAESWALVHYLLQARPDRDRYETLSELLTDAPAAEASITKYFGKDAAFGNALLAYVGQAALPRSTLPLAQGIAPRPPATFTPFSVAETEARLGDLLAHLDRRDEAREHLRKSFALAPDLPAANASMGLLLVRQDNFADGRKFLEKAVAGGNTDPFVSFNLAWSIIQTSMNADREVEQFSAADSRRIRELLQRTIDAAPEFADARRMLAFVKMVDGDDLTGAADLARKAVEMDPANDEHRLLLARILLREEKYVDARSTAQGLTQLATDPRVRAEAAEIVKAADAYFAARDLPSPDKVLIVYNPLPPLILKRSGLTDAQIAEFDRDRVITNLNRILPRAKAGERQAVGYINAVRCRDDGSVEYDVSTADGQRPVFGSRDFSSLRMSVLTEGENTFNIGCGSRFGRQLLVLTYRPPDPAKPTAKPELVAVAFVPPEFRLKTPEEMAKARLVVVEDDTISSRGQRKP